MNPMNHTDFPQERDLSMASGKRSYRIAFFTVDWNYELVESTLHGLKQFVDDHQNVSLSVFDCFGKDLNNSKDKSEYAIFRLPDLTRFDGLLVQGNQIVLQPAREELGRRIAESGVPAVSIGCPIEGCTLIHIDNRAAQHDMAEHVIRTHRVKRIVYLTGNLHNDCPEARQRLDGLMDACRENGIPEKNVEVIHCTWRTSDGADVALRWIKENRELPDAFICGNDEMALGLMETLKKNGIRIPQDVIVTGFDNLTSAELSSPRLSTAWGNNRQLNYDAMELLIRMIDGEKTEADVPVEHSVICSESCGCHEKAGISEVREQFFQQSQFLKSFYNLQDRMAEELFEANNLVDLALTVSHNRRIFGCKDIFLCINDYYFDSFEKSEWEQDSESFGEEMVLAIRRKTDSPSDTGTDFIRFPTKDLLPKRIMRQERFLIFYPLHYNTYSIGYIALDGISDAAKMNLHESIFNFLEIAIENVRKKELLRQFNETLDELYVHDSLTGLYNRFGLNRFGREVFNWLMERDGAVQVLFTDMDDMKLINDKYGHNLGDEALKASAAILTECCSPEDFIMRYGGDEFVVIAGSGEKDLAERILKEAAEYNTTSGMPFTLGFSIGTVRAEASRGKTMDDCIKEADAAMYEVKAGRKAGRQ